MYAGHIERNADRRRLNQESIGMGQFEGKVAVVTGQVLNVSGDVGLGTTS